MSAFAFKIFDTQAIIANIYLVFLCASHCSERFAFNLLHPHSHPTRQALLLTHFINGAMEISNLPKVHNWPAGVPGFCNYHITAHASSDKRIGCEGFHGTATFLFSEGGIFCVNMYPNKFFPIS